VSQERYSAGTHGSSNMVGDLRHAGQRKHDNPVPKLTVRPDCWLAFVLAVRGRSTATNDARC
jgi:hypothetical protein